VRSNVKNRRKKSIRKKHGHIVQHLLFPHLKVLHWYSENQYISILFGVCDLQLGVNPYSFGMVNLGCIFIIFKMSDVQL
jgi:hypothetical protein